MRKKIVVSTILDKAPKAASLMHGQVSVAAGENQGARWLPGERLDQLFEEQCDRLRETGQGSHLAVDSGDLTLTYDQLDGRPTNSPGTSLHAGAAPATRSRCCSTRRCAPSSGCSRC